MAINTKAIKSRISSVQNTKKITRAMQMIAAVKMKKAVDMAVNTREYAKLAQQLMENLSQSKIDHPLAIPRKNTQNILLIIMTSNRGLCGSYNSAVLKRAHEFVNENKDKNISVIALGKKAAQFAKRNHLEILGIYEKLNEKPNYEDILPIAKTMMEGYLDKTFDQCVVLYTNYISGLNQNVELRQIVPFTKQSLEEFYKGTGAHSTSEELETVQKSYEEFDFEPGKEQVLDYVMPLLVEIQIFQAMLESTASEHSSRMIAMKNATDSAGEMIDDLTLEFNKGRQAAITQEISEIVGGVAALG